MEKGDILGHEFCGVVESMGPAVKNLQVGDRVVASFQIACGDVSISSHCARLLLTFPVFLLQAEAIISMREDKLKYPGERHGKRDSPTAPSIPNNNHSTEDALLACSDTLISLVAL